MKHSDLRFWFLDDSIDGYVTDRSETSRNYGKAADNIANKTPEKKFIMQNEGKGYRNYQASSIQDIDELLSHKSYSQ